MQETQITVDSIRREAERAVSKLGRIIGNNSAAEPDFGRAWESLEALPLTSDEFCQVANHLQNAERYWRTGENGAAKYELKLLEGLLSPDSNDAAIEPPRRQIRTIRRETHGRAVGS